MKLNICQKIMLLLYSFLFVYFAIIHVPFKNNRGGIKYDTLFSTISNLDVSRLILIILVLSMLTAVLLLLFRNVVLINKLKVSTNGKRVIAIVLIGIVFISAAIIAISKYQKAESYPEKKTTADNTSVRPTVVVQKPSQLEIKKAETCTKESALRNFNSYMKFYYPDWKIYSLPVVQEQSDCKYQIQFTTLDPHVRYQKEVIIVQISFNYDYTQYNFSTVRGTLY